MTLPRADVPPAFCERFCCAWRGRCDPMTARPGVCLWSPGLAVQAMETGKNQLNRELFSWLHRLKQRG
jgi:hypothetical protein